MVLIFFSRYANSANIAEVVTNALMDLIITAGWVLDAHPCPFRSFLLLQYCWWNICSMMQWLNNCVGKKNYITFVSLMATSLVWVKFQILFEILCFVIFLTPGFTCIRYVPQIQTKYVSHIRLPSCIAVSLLLNSELVLLSLFDALWIERVWIIK
jgi:hypothetical protein